MYSAASVVLLSNTAITCVLPPAVMARVSRMSPASFRIAAMKADFWGVRYSYSLVYWKILSDTSLRVMPYLLRLVGDFGGNGSKPPGTGG